jgi:hypothetical protein
MMYYSIKPLATGYRLSIWEPASVTHNRVNPFHFKLNFTIISPREAEKILNLIPGQKIEARRASGSVSNQVALVMS